MPVPVLVGPHGAGKGGLVPVPEYDGPDYRDKQRQADAEDEKGDWAESSAATVLGSLLQLPTTSFL